MKEFNKIYLISDIHGYAEGLIAADKVCTNDKPLFILGDLFDHIYGKEQQIVDLLLKMIEEKRCYVVIGNHDEVLNIIFFRHKSDQVTIEELTNSSVQVVTKVLKTLFSELFYYRYEAIRQDLQDSIFNDEIKVANYYRQVDELIVELGFEHVVGKLEQLFKCSNYYEEVQVGNKKLLLTHSGSKTCPFDLQVITNSYKLDEDYDYGVMGHMSSGYIESALASIEDSIDFSNFAPNQQLDGLGIEGDYVFNNSSKTVMIDNLKNVKLIAVSSSN